VAGRGHLERSFWQISDKAVLVTVVIAWQGRLRVIVLVSIDLAHQLGPSAR
jgi:hypothetical protein